MNDEIYEFHKLVAARDDRIAQLESEKDTLAGGICDVWGDYLGGATASVTVDRLRAEFCHEFPLSLFPISHAPAPAPASAPADPTPSSNPAPVIPAPTHPASDNAPDGEKIGKSAKTIKVTFQSNDSAVLHLQKERSLCHEVGLFYPNVNTATKVGIVISHCDPQVKGIAISVRDSAASLFDTLDAFLLALRLERFPSFNSDCRVSFQEMKQKSTETCLQFYFNFIYLLKAMDRNVEHFHDEFFKKLLYPDVISKVRFLPRNG